MELSADEGKHLIDQIAALKVPVFVLTGGDPIKRPDLFRKYSMIAVSMFFLFFIFEIVGVAFGYWYFPGSQYIGTVTVFRSTFPIEEIIFWMFFYPATIVSYYETFIDDMK